MRRGDGGERRAKEVPVHESLNHKNAKPLT